MLKYQLQASIASAAETDLCCLAPPASRSSMTHAWYMAKTKTDIVGAGRSIDHHLKGVSRVLGILIVVYYKFATIFSSNVKLVVYNTMCLKP